MLSVKAVVFSLMKILLLRYLIFETKVLKLLAEVMSYVGLEK